VYSLQLIPYLQHTILPQFRQCQAMLELEQP
jgi:hypothetical protein